MIIRQIETLYDPGTTKVVEDGTIVNPPFFGVVDGFSMPYCGEPPRFDGLSGGQMVKKCAVGTFHQATPAMSLEQVTDKARHQIAVFHKSIQAETPDQMAGASFAVAKIADGVIDIFQGGDSLIIWISRDLQFHITENRFYPTEVTLRNMISQLMKRHNGDRTAMWREFLPFMREVRKTTINRKHAILNGQPEMMSLMQRIVIDHPENLALMIFLTDGFVPFSQIDGACPHRLANEVVKKYAVGGLAGVLKWTREVEAKEAETSHETFAEATALVVTFK